MRDFIDKYNAQLLLVVALLVFSSISNGVMDTIQFHYQGSVFDGGNDQFWNPKVSWENKYAKGPDGIQRPYKPRYFGSTTFLSFTTDGWHLFKALFLWFNRAAMVVLFDLFLIERSKSRLLRFGIACVAWIVLSIAYMGFHLFYSII